MIGLDTNVLVRYLTLDDPIQSPRAVEIMERRLSTDTPGYISTVVIAELVWVLERRYHWDKGALGGVVERFLRADHLLLEHAQEVFLAMTALKNSNADFTDALIAAVAHSVGCDRTLTFDRRALRLPQFQPA